MWSKILPTLVVSTANATAGGLLIVSSLTFLGIGVVPPEPTWGGIVASDLGYLTQRPYGPVFPSLFIMATVGALNLLADAIKDSRRRPRPRADARERRSRPCPSHLTPRRRSARSRTP